MSNFEQKDGQGSLFKDEKKVGSQPDYRGSVKIKGETYKLAGWVKESKTGKKFLSLKIESIDLTPKKESNESTGGDLPF
jgi:uncharacterized protein (DUF736 family)